MVNKVVAISGGFDPLHIGHLRLMQEAAAFGKVVAILHSDQWLINKKGYYFMPYEQREEVLLAIRWIFSVVPAIDQQDGGVDHSLAFYQPDIFVNGGDRTETPLKERLAVESYGGKVMNGIGGGKIQSSSWLVNGRLRKL